MSDELLLKAITKTLQDLFKNARPDWQKRDWTLAATIILNKINKPLPTDEEIHIKIVDVLFGYMTVPELREWLKERFR